MNTKTVLSNFFVEPKKEVGREVLTIPNLITSIGIILIGIYVVQVYLDLLLIIAPVTLFLAGATDLLDGVFARALDQHTRPGKFLDFSRDKLLIGGLCFGILWTNGPSLMLPMGIWIGCEVILFARDLLCTLNESMQTHIIGKMGQAITLLCVGGFLAQEYWLSFDIIPLPALLWTIAVTAAMNCIFVCSFTLLFRS